MSLIDKKRISEPRNDLYALKLTLCLPLPSNMLNPKFSSRVFKASSKHFVSTLSRDSCIQHASSRESASLRPFRLTLNDVKLDLTCRLAQQFSPSPRAPLFQFVHADSVAKINCSTQVNCVQTIPFRLGAAFYIYGTSLELDHSAGMKK